MQMISAWYSKSQFSICYSFCIWIIHNRFDHTGVLQQGALQIVMTKQLHDILIPMPFAHPCSVSPPFCVFTFITSRYGCHLVPSPSPHPPLHTAMPAGAVWTSTKDTALVELLVKNRSEADDRGNFKSLTFQLAVPYISSLTHCAPVRFTVQWGGVKCGGNTNEINNIHSSQCGGGGMKNNVHNALQSPFQGTRLSNSRNQGTLVVPHSKSGMTSIPIIIPYHNIPYHTIIPNLSQGVWGPFSKI